MSNFHEFSSHPLLVCSAHSQSSTPFSQNNLSGHCLTTAHPERQAAAPETALPVNLPPAAAVSLSLLLDCRATVLAANLSGAAQLGYRLEELVSRSVLELVHEQNRDWFSGIFQAFLSPQTTALQLGEIDLLDRDGIARPVRVTLQPLHTLPPPPIALPAPHCHSLQSAGPSYLIAMDCQFVVPALHNLESMLQRWQESERIRNALARLRTSLARDLRQSLNLQPLLQTIVRETRQLLSADRVLIYSTYPEVSSKVLVEAIAPGRTSLLERSLPSDLLPTSNRADYSNGFIQTISNIQRQTATPPLETLQDADVCAVMAVPILLRENLWGLLIVHQCHPRPWQTWEAELMTQISTQLEVAIQQTELYQQVQRLNSALERQIQSRTAELELARDFEATLKRITDKVRDSLNEDQILQTAVQELATALGLGACNAALYDLDKGISTICYEHVTTLAPAQGRIASLNTFPEIYQPLLQGQYVQFCSILPHPRRGHVAMLAVPIFDDKGVLGDLWLINQRYYGFSEQDIRLAQQVANQCAIALRQARLFQAARTQVEELEKLNLLKDDFLSTVSHELRTPMSNIKMATQMLGLVLKQSGILNEASSRASKYFQILQEECQREINLINDLLDLSRLGAGAEVLNISRFNLPDWLASLLPPFQERAQSHGQTLTLDLPTALPTLASDPSKLERILTELLTNACKYTPHGEHITLSARPAHQILHPTRPPIPLLELSVTNSGIEIPEHERDRIFQAFYRIPNHDPWKYGGTGLGLALIKKLTEYLGGTLEVRSGDRQTHFTIKLPLNPEAED